MKGITFTTLLIITVAVVSIAIAAILVSQQTHPEKIYAAFSGNATSVFESMKNLALRAFESQKSLDMSGIMVLPVNTILTNDSVLGLSTSDPEKTFEYYIATPYPCVCYNVTRITQQNYGCSGPDSTCYPPSFKDLQFFGTYYPEGLNSPGQCFFEYNKQCHGLVIPFKEGLIGDEIPTYQKHLYEPPKICQAIYECLDKTLSKDEECVLEFDGEPFIVENETFLDFESVLNVIQKCPQYPVTKKMNDGSVYTVCTWKPSDFKNKYNTYQDTLGYAHEVLKKEDGWPELGQNDVPLPENGWDSPYHFDVLKYDIFLEGHDVPTEYIDLWITLEYADGNSSQQYFIAGGPETWDGWTVMNSLEHFQGVLTDKSTGKPVSGEIKKVWVHLRNELGCGFKADDTIKIELFRDTKVPTAILYPYCSYTRPGMKNTLFYYIIPSAQTTDIYQQPFSLAYPGPGRVKFVLRDFNATDCSFNIDMCAQAKASEEYGDSGMNIYQFFRNFDIYDTPNTTGYFTPTGSSDVFSYACYGPYEIDLDRDYNVTEIFSAVATGFEEWKATAPARLNTESGAIFDWAKENVSGSAYWAPRGATSWNSQYFHQSPENDKCVFYLPYDSSNQYVPENSFFNKNSNFYSTVSNKLTFYVTFVGNETKPYTIHVNMIPGE
jgi:type II secretory pathway pseudopilin PulG